MLMQQPLVHNIYLKIYYTAKYFKTRYKAAIMYPIDSASIGLDPKYEATTFDASFISPTIDHSTPFPGNTRRSNNQQGWKAKRNNEKRELFKNIQPVLATNCNFRWRIRCSTTRNLRRRLTCYLQWRRFSGPRDAVQLVITAISQVMPIPVPLREDVYRMFLMCQR